MKNPELEEMVICPTCNGTGIDGEEWDIYDKTGSEFLETITDFDLLPEEEKQYCTCKTCNGTKEIEIDQYYELVEKPFND
jgi:predicted methyltransferase